VARDIVEQQSQRKAQLKLHFAFARLEPSRRNFLSRNAKLDTGRLI
jgi:hypothetical protein